MKITLLADIHISDSPELSHGVDTKLNFSRCITRVRELKPDHAVLMGDYSLHEPRRADVKWVAERMHLADCEFSAIVGNHDVAEDVAELCMTKDYLVGDRLYYRRDFGHVRALFLDTARGTLDVAQLEWVRQDIERANGPILIFMHYPPVEAGVPFMDENWALRDVDGAIYEALFGGVKPVTVFCGHYHAARSIQVGPHSVHLCPSTYYQLDANVDEFAVAHAMPALRHVEVIDGQVRTWVDVLAGK